MYILGVSALYHDSAAAIIKDGEIIAAAQEERFTRIKHDSSIPENAINYCLRQANIISDDLDAIVYYDNPLLTTSRYFDNLRYVGNDASDIIDFQYVNLTNSKLWINVLLSDVLGGRLGKNNKLFVAEHHISHAASAFFASPYEEAAIITIDGVGEYATTTLGIGSGNKIQLLEQIGYPHSLGLLYSAFTYFCGFKVNSGDYKLMGLAPYGEPIYYNLIKEKIIDIKSDGSYRLNMDYFDYHHGRAMTNEKFATLFGGDRREPESQITKREMDMAASVQKVVEEVVVLMARHLKDGLGEEVKNLVMAGGVALNCVANGVLAREKIFENIWIQPAAGDAGGALGAALYYYYHHLDNERKVDNVHDLQKGSYLGPEYSSEDIERYLQENGYAYHRYIDKGELYAKVADIVAGENVVGLLEGRMEFGPRALGNRSIIADPRSEKMQSILNLKIKYRESFRPFAPSVLYEKAGEYFELVQESPYMLICSDVRSDKRKKFKVDEEVKRANNNLLEVVNGVRSNIPAVTHVDYSARIQTVTREGNPDYYGILEAFYKKTGCGVLINTSFNVRGEPIVMSPEDAYLCFMRTDMDVLVLNDCILYKEEQEKFQEDIDWRLQYALD